MEDNQKVKAKAKLQDDVQHLIARLIYTENEINNMILLINNVLAGGQTTAFFDICHVAQHSLNNANKMLNVCKHNVSQLSTKTN